VPVWHGNSSPTVTRRFMPSKAGGMNGMRRNMQLRPSRFRKEAIMGRKKKCLVHVPSLKYSWGQGGH